MKVIKFYLYKHTCPNGKTYIGITQQEPEKRWKNGYGYRKNKHFFSAIIKYGWDNVKHEVMLSNLDEKEASIKEIEFIEKYKSNQREYGYNNDFGGYTGSLKSEETKIKISIKNSGKNNGMYGKHNNLSQKAREQIREKNKKNGVLFEKGFIPWNKNKKMTKEHRDKLEKTYSKSRKKVLCVETGVKAYAGRNVIGIMANQASSIINTYSSLDAFSVSGCGYGIMTICGGFIALPLLHSNSINTVGISANNGGVISASTTTSWSTFGTTPSATVNGGRINVGTQ